MYGCLSFCCRLNLYVSAEGNCIARCPLFHTPLHGVGYFVPVEKKGEWNDMFFGQSHLELGALYAEFQRNLINICEKSAEGSLWADSRLRKRSL